jgi:hypothetical protein
MSMCAGYGPLYARTYSNRCLQCDRLLYPRDGPSYYFRKISHTRLTSFLRSGLRCDYIRRPYTRLYAEQKRGLYAGRRRSMNARHKCDCMPGTGGVYTQGTYGVWTQGIDAALRGNAASIKKSLFYLPHMEYEGSIGLVTRKMKFF